MNEALKRFSTALADELRKKLASQQIEEFIKATKASGDDRSFEVVMSTADEDRQGDSLDQSRWDLKYYTMNPVLLWAHNYQGFPIGVIEDITIEGDKAVATGKFAPAGVNPEADMACALYQQKILRAVSPGYIQNDDGTRELLEVSFCPVPAGRYALSLRQVSQLGVSTQELVTKGFFYEEKKEKSPQIGDTCETDDGTHGILAEDDKNPGTLVCVPSKSNKSETMNTELEKKIKAEHERHGKAVGKAIDEFEKKALPDEEKKANGGDEYDKAIDEFKGEIDGEQEDHLDKCMKAIDESYELQDQKKSIDEFKSEMKAEHLKHVKAIDKAMDGLEEVEHPGDGEDWKPVEDAIQEFTEKAQDELARHEKAHEELCEKEAEGETEAEKAARMAKKGAVAEELQEDELLKQKYEKLDNAYSVFYAFTSAYMDESVAVDDFEKLLDEAVELMKNIKGKAKTAVLAKALFNKAGRAISAKNKDAIEKVIKTIEDFHTEHGKATDEVTAALKAIVSSGDGGEEPSNEPKGDEKSLNSRSSTSGASAELEAYLFNQRLARQVKTAAEDALRQINQKIKKARTSGR
jgi:hypothetical protein